MPKTRPAYPAEFRRQMVDLVRAGRDPIDLAREFEPSRQAIQNWVAEADRGKGHREARAHSAEVDTGSALESASQQGFRAVPDCNAVGHGSKPPALDPDRPRVFNEVSQQQAPCSAKFPNRPQKRGNPNPRYRLTDRALFLEVRIPVTAAGSGSATVNVNLPAGFTAASDCVLGGREFNNITNNDLVARVSSGNEGGQFLMPKAPIQA